MLDIKTNGEVKTLLKAMLEVINEVENIPKNGYNTTMDYNYVLERDVLDTLRKSLASKGIVIIPSIVETSEREILLDNGEPTIISKVVMSYTFFDTQNGGSITTYGVGEGQDSLDKGIYKAITGCQKYVLLKTFMIPTGGDPEEDPEEDMGSIINSVQSKPKKSRGRNAGNGPNDRVSTDIANRIYAIGQKDKNKLAKVLDRYGYKDTFEIQYKNLAAINRELVS